MSTDRREDGTPTRWEGYSNYEEVSKRVAGSVSDAVDSYAMLQAAHREGAHLQSDVAADARADIIGAATRLLVELENDAEEVEKYQTILDDWTGEDGYIQKFHEHSFREDGVPGWTWTFVRQIRAAGWELGYLQAGRANRVGDEDPVENDAKAMFD